MQAYKIFGIIVFAVLSNIMSACVSFDKTSNITVEQAWIRPADAGASVTGAFLTIENTGNGEDRLLSVITSVADVIEIHETRVVNDIAAMIPQEDGVVIPANQIIRFQPGGLHLMVLNVSEALEEGRTVELTLVFESGLEMTIEALVSLQAPQP